MRGYAAIGLHQPKNRFNYGNVVRAAHCYGAAMIAISGTRLQVERVVRAPENCTHGERHLPILRGDDLKSLIPYNCVPVAVEFIQGAIELQNYQHPNSAFYIFGPEDGSLGDSVLSWCRDVVVIPAKLCINLAAAVNIVLYDRVAKQLLDAKRPEKPRWIAA